MKRRRVTYRPSKAQGVFGVSVGAVFVVLGVVMVIPIFGPFGILWTLIAVGIMAMNGYQAFGKGYTGPEIHIEEDAPEGEPPASAPVEHNAKERLEQLQSLLDSGLITQEEYERKRQEILSRL